MIAALEGARAVTELEVVASRSTESFLRAQLGDAVAAATAARASLEAATEEKEKAGQRISHLETAVTAHKAKMHDMAEAHDAATNEKREKSNLFARKTLAQLYDAKLAATATRDVAVSKIAALEQAEQKLVDAENRVDELKALLSSEKHLALETKSEAAAVLAAEQKRVRALHECWSHERQITIRETQKQRNEVRIFSPSFHGGVSGHSLSIS